MPSPHLDPLNIDRQLYTLLGRVVAHWAYIETEVGEMFCYFTMANPGAMYVATQSVAAASVSNWTRTLVKTSELDEITISEICSLLSAVDEIRAERNAYVHGLWSRGPERIVATVQTVRLDRATPVKEELVTQADLISLLESIHETFEALVAIGQKLGYRKSG